MSAVSGASRPVLGIDLGGTKVQGVRVEVMAHAAEPVVHSQARVATPSGGAVSDVLDAIAAVVADLGGTADGAAVGVGAPGVVDAGTGVVHVAPNLGWHDEVALGDLLGERLGVDVVVDNDVNVATVAEHRLGAGRGSADLLGVFWGTGVGGGLILDGVVRRGPHGRAGEIGHLIVRDGGRRCGCGLDGHVEAYAGRAAMEREARRRHAEGDATLLVDLAGDGRMKSSVLAKALAGGDAIAAELLGEAVEALAAGIASVAVVVDIDRVVVGGGVADKLGPEVVQRVADATARRLFGGGRLPVVAAALGDLGGALGAALVAAGGPAARGAAG